MSRTRTLINDVARETTLFHAGGTVTWQIEEELIEFIERNVTGGMHTLETGLGYSTAAFLTSGARHVAITPSADEVFRFSQFAASAGLALDGFHPIVLKSEEVLPSLRLWPLDRVLIDGGHGFPIPMIDFAYTHKWLKVGGLMIVDDLQLYSPRVLCNFLRAESDWTEVWSTTKSAVFRKVRGTDNREWNEQGISAETATRPTAGVAAIFADRLGSYYARLPGPLKKAARALALRMLR